MTILVDTLSIAARAGGIRVYVRELVSHLEGQAVIHLICSRANVHLFRDLPAARIIVVPGVGLFPGFRVVLQQLLVPIIAWRTKPSVLFAPVDIAPLLAPVPIVTCVHSSHINTHLGASRGLKAWYGKLFMRWTLRRSAAVIVISDYVRDMTAELFDVAPSSLQVIYHGGGLIEAAEERGWQAPTDDNRNGPVLFTGTLHRHKNVEKLLEAYALLRERMPAAPPLAVVGSDVRGEQDRLRAIADRLGIRPHVSFEGRVSDDALMKLLEASPLLVYPSSIEGFGLPVLEAMRAGVPVVASNRSSIPEVVGDAGILIDPDDVDVFADTMQTVLTDSALRKRLIAAGLARSRQFNWTRTARETLDVFRSVARA